MLFACLQNSMSGLRRAALLLAALALAGPLLSGVRAATAAVSTESAANYPAHIDSQQKTHIESLRRSIVGGNVSTASSTAPNPNPPKTGPAVKVSAEVAAPWHSIARPSGASCAVRAPYSIRMPAGQAPGREGRPACAGHASAWIHPGVHASPSALGASFACVCVQAKSCSAGHACKLDAATPTVACNKR